MGYSDPSTWTDWEADFNCEACEKDTLHMFYRQSSVTYVQCSLCSFETELDPDYYE